MLFARAPVDGSFVVDVLPAMILLGIGAGIAFNPLLLAAMSDVAPQESGLASGVVNTAFMMGGALGLAVLASIAASRTDSLARRRQQRGRRAERRLPRGLPRRRSVRPRRRPSVCDRVLPHRTSPQAHAGHETPRRGRRDGARFRTVMAWRTSNPPPGGRATARAAPLRADRVLLPHARFVVRGRGRGAGDDDSRVALDRPVRGPRGAALVALPHRDERLPRHAEGARAARTADGSRARARVVDLAAGADAARGRVARSRSPTRASSRPRRTIRPSSRSRARRSSSHSSPRSSTCRRSSARC